MHVSWLMFFGSQDSDIVSKAATYFLGRMVVPKQYGVSEDCLRVLHVFLLHQHADPLLHCLQQQSWYQHRVYLLKSAYRSSVKQSRICRQCTLVSRGVIEQVQALACLSSGDMSLS